MSTEDKILRAILDAAREGRISCAEARKLAEDLRVTPKEIGMACDEMKIKIHSCELGCF